jgi:hypothetical protein
MTTTTTTTTTTRMTIAPRGARDRRASSSSVPSAPWSRARAGETRGRRRRRARVLARTFSRRENASESSVSVFASETRRSRAALADGARRRRTRGARAATPTTTRTRAEKTSVERESEIDEVTKKWGLEAGLWRVFKSDASSEGETEEGEVGASRMDMAKKLLKRYGSAYLLTSISLSLVSITVFYFLVAGGVDVGALLEKVGITVNATSEQFGTFALAYAAHKGSSPIRFGPTVALTPLVAKWLGKEANDDDDDDEGGSNEGESNDGADDDAKDA